MRSITIAALATLGLVALAGIASADPDECPDCHPQPAPVKNDCGFSSVHEGDALSNNTTEAGRVEACIANAHHPQGLWAKLSLCFSAIAHGISEMLGIDAGVDVFASQDGVDVDATVDVADHHADFDDSALDDVDDTTWQTLAEVHAHVDGPLQDAGVDTRDNPVGGDDLPHVNLDICPDIHLDC
jgi:hypothetical protein